MRSHPFPSDSSSSKHAMRIRSFLTGFLFKSVGVMILAGSLTLGGCTASSSGSSSSPPLPDAASPSESQRSDSDSDSDTTTPDTVPTTDLENAPNPSADSTVSNPVTLDEEMINSASSDMNAESDIKGETSAESAETDATNSSSDSSNLFIPEDHLDSFLYQYYDLINQGQYQQAWAKLAPDMQTDSSYDSYLEWWSSINRADVQSINHVYAGDLGGQVMVLVSYDKKKGPISREVLVMDIGAFSPENSTSETPEKNTNSGSSQNWQIKSVDVAKSVSPTNPQDATPLTPISTLVIDGIGSIRVGMTLQEAANATGLPMATRGLYDRDDCDYYQAIGSPNGIFLMVSNGRIVRVDIETETIKTPSGAGLGSSVDEIKALYPGKIETSGHQYVQDGQYLRFVPTDAADRDYRILFETDENGKVTSFRSGFADPVGYVEGCS